MTFNGNIFDDSYRVGGAFKGIIFSFNLVQGGPKDQVGAKMEGIYVGSHTWDARGDNGETVKKVVYDFVNCKVNGVKVDYPISIHAKAVLDKVFQTAAPGVYAGIEYQGLGERRNGKNAPHMFKIGITPNVVAPNWRELRDGASTFDEEVSVEAAFAQPQPQAVPVQPQVAPQMPFFGNAVATDQVAPVAPAISHAEEILQIVMTRNSISDRQLAVAKAMELTGMAYLPQYQPEMLAKLKQMYGVA